MADTSNVLNEAVVTFPELKEAMDRVNIEVNTQIDLKVKAAVDKAIEGLNLDDLIGGAPGGSGPSGPGNWDYTEGGMGDPQYVYYDDHDEYWFKKDGTKQPEVVEHYAFTYNQSESMPTMAIQYPSGYDNYNFSPMFMDYETGQFNYGAWQNAWFIKNLRVVMMDFHGNILYEINPWNYKQKKYTGEPVGNEGCVMVGIPRIYYYLQGSGTSNFTVHVANYKISSNYHAWAFHDKYGVEKKWLWVSAYDVGLDEESGLYVSRTGLINDKDKYNHHEFYKPGNIVDALNPTSGHTYGIWFSQTFAWAQLMQILMWLLGKNTNRSAPFGVGLDSGGKLAGASSDDLRAPSGMMDDKGLFFGATDGTIGMKFMGMENVFGGRPRPIIGWCRILDKEFIKLTWGKEDGSTGEGFEYGSYLQTTLSTYLKTNRTSKNGDYIKRWYIMNNKYFVADDTDVTGASRTTYTCEREYYSPSASNSVMQMTTGYPDAGCYCNTGSNNKAMDWKLLYL